MVTSFGCCFAYARRAFQSLNHWRSCKVQIKMGEGEMVGDRGMTMKVEDAWNLCGMGMLSCIQARLGISV